MDPETATISIDTLALELPLRDEAHGRTLAREVVRALERMPALPMPQMSGQIDSLQVELPPFPAGATDAEIAQTTARGIHSALVRALAQFDGGAPSHLLADNTSISGGAGAGGAQVRQRVSDAPDRLQIDPEAPEDLVRPQVRSLNDTAKSIVYPRPGVRGPSSAGGTGSSPDVFFRLTYPARDQRVVVRGEQKGRVELSPRIELARQLIDQSFKSIQEQLAEQPPAASRAERAGDVEARTNLKEALRRFTRSTPLNVELREDLRGTGDFETVSEEGPGGKRQGALSLPIQKIIGQEQPGFPRTSALSSSQRDEQLLHELVHVMLVDRGADADAVWKQIDAGIVRGPAGAVKAGESLVHIFLLGQEELFAYRQVAALGGTFGSLRKESSEMEQKLASTEADKTRLRYEAWERRAATFLFARAQSATREYKLDGARQGQGETGGLSISYRYPKELTVRTNDVDLIGALIESFPTALKGAGRGP